MKIVKLTHIIIISAELILVLATVRKECGPEGHTDKRRHYVMEMFRHIATGTVKCNSGLKTAGAIKVWSSFIYQALFYYTGLPLRQLH